MKKLLLSAILMSVSFAGYSQTFYPSGNTNVPTWGYDDVVADNDGNFYNNKTGKSGNCIDDAELNYHTFNRGDAYDGAFEFFINIQDSVYTESGLAAIPKTVDTTGTTISMSEQLINGLYVSKSYYFSPTSPIVRAAFKIRNPTPNNISTKVGIYANMGSDNATLMDTSSTDGTNLSNADRWMVTTDGYSYNAGDPINTWVRFGPGVVQSSPIFGQKPESGSDDYLDTFAISVPANSYAIILQFNRMDSTRAAARTNTATFNTTASLQAAGLLTGLSNSDLANVVNWNFSSILPSAEPTVAASNLRFTGVTSTSLTLNWTNGNGASRLVVLKQGTATNQSPSDGSSYTASTTFGNGSNLGTGNYVVYDGIVNSVTVTGLLANTTYYAEVFEYNGIGITSNYYTSATLTGNRTTLANSTTGILAAVESDKISLIPNPNNGSVEINYSQISNISAIRILNVVGIEVKNIPSNSGSITNLDTTDLESGIYYIHFSSDNKEVVKKMIKY